MLNFTEEELKVLETILEILEANKMTEKVQIGIPIKKPIR